MQPQPKRLRKNDVQAIRQQVVDITEQDEEDEDEDAEDEDAEDEDAEDEDAEDEDEAAEHSMHSTVHFASRAAWLAHQQAIMEGHYAGEFADKRQRMDTAEATTIRSLTAQSSQVPSQAEQREQEEDQQTSDHHPTLLFAALAPEMFAAFRREPWQPDIEGSEAEQQEPEEDQQSSDNPTELFAALAPEMFAAFRI